MLCWRSIVLLLFLAGCRSQPEGGTGPRYAESGGLAADSSWSLAIHPLHNPARLGEAYGPLVRLLNERLDGPRLKLEASRDYADFERKIRARLPQLLLPNPWQTLLAMRHGYRVVAMAGDPADFRGLFLVKREAEFRDPRELRGKSVAYPSPTALAACLLPQRFLLDHGLDPLREVRTHYVGSQESAILSVLAGTADAGVTWPPPWRMFQRDHPEQAARLRVAWVTPNLASNSVMVRDDVPQAWADDLVRELGGLEETKEGLAILAGMQTAHFNAAGDRDYEGVRRFIADFEREIRPVEAP